MFVCSNSSGKDTPLRAVGSRGRSFRGAKA
jgi:hypothetical protein